VIVLVYNGRWLHLTVHGDCVLRAVTHMRCYSYRFAFCLLLTLGYIVGE